MIRGRTAVLLDTLAWVRPYHWSRFYERTRVYRAELEVERPQVMLNITRECPFRCAFCFAADAMGSGIRLSLEQVRDIGSELRGIGKLMLIGGEPLSHPDITEVMAEVSTWTDEIEIFTNGVYVSADAGRAERYVTTRLLAEKSRPILTLAVDDYHREQFGGDRFRKLIDVFLELPRLAPVQTRFNVTAHAIRSRGYQPVDTVREVLARFHPGLVELLEEGSVDRKGARLYLNPVIRMGDARGFSEAEAENLRASDVLTSPEIALCLDPAGRMTAFGFLPATWMPRAPQATILGFPDETSLSDLVHRTIVEPALEIDRDDALGREVLSLLVDERAGCLGDPRAAGRTASERVDDDDGLATSLALRRHLAEGDLASCARVLEVRPFLRWLKVWPEAHDAYFAHLAGRLRDLFDPAPETAFDLFGFDDVRRLPVQAVSGFLAGYLTAVPAAADALAADIRDLCDGLARDGEVLRYGGLRIRSGMIRIPAEPRALGQATLNLDLRTAWGHHADKGLIEALVSVTEDGSVNLEFDGVVRAAGDSAERESSVETYLGLVRVVVGSALNDRLAGLGAGAEPTAGGNAGGPSSSTDPIEDVFEHLVHERTDAVWRNGEALACLALESWDAWPTATADRWRATIVGSCRSLLRRPQARDLSAFARETIARSVG